MKKLGFGLMRMPLLDPDNDASVDIEQVKKDGGHLHRERVHLF